MCARSRGALEPGQFFLAKDLRDKAHVFVRQKVAPGPLLVTIPHSPARDAGAQQTVVSQHRRVRVAEHAEKSALVLRKAVGIRRLVEIDFVWGEITLNNPLN